MEKDASSRISKVLQNFLLWRSIAIISVLLHLFSLLLTSLGLRAEEPILYWQKYLQYIWYFRFFTFFIVLLSLWLSSEKKQRNKSTLIAVFGSVAILCYIQYFLLFAGTFVTHIGTVQLNNKAYQYVQVVKYDDETGIYLGECERDVVNCRFSTIYYLTMSSQASSPKIEMIGNKQEVSLELGNDPICLFDGFKINCRDSDYGYRVNNKFEE
jgi:hypothetical protein